MPVVVGGTEPPSVTHDGVIPAKRAAPWQEVQRDHPGSMLSFVSRSEIKRSRLAWRPAATVSAKFRSAGRAFTLPA